MWDKDKTQGNERGACERAQRKGNTRGRKNARNHMHVRIYCRAGPGEMVMTSLEF